MNPRTGAWVTKFTLHGYAWVSVDIRGSGASTGSKSTIDFSDQETADSEEVLAWIRSQSWSDDQVIGYALGYDGAGVLSVSNLSALVINGAPLNGMKDALVPQGW